jgi:hypothetical protein
MFLPQMRAANEELEQTIAEDPATNVNIDYISDEEKPYIEMEIAKVPLSEAEKIEKIDDSTRVDDGSTTVSSSSSSSSSSNDTGLTPRVSSLLPSSENVSKKKGGLIEVLQ